MNNCLVCGQEIPAPFAFCSDTCEQLYEAYADIIDNFNMEAKGFYRPDDQPVDVEAAVDVDRSVAYDRQYNAARAALDSVRKKRHNEIRYMWYQHKAAQAKLPAPMPEPNIPRLIVGGLMLFVPLLVGLTCLVTGLEAYGSFMRFLGYNVP